MQWIRSLQAISQNGLHFSSDSYDRERYEQIAKISAEILEHHSSLSAADVLNLNKAEFGYATPKVDVRGAAFRDGKILLVRETADQGRWTLPGGWADVNEAPGKAVVREVFEESGFETRAVKLLAVYDRETQGHLPSFPYTVYKLFFLCEITGGKECPNSEASEIAFFGENELPELSIERVKPEQIRRCFEHLRQPGLATDFD
jgi:ADP-ribose pyrophosphatase YjhB (NUDIX family)